MTTSNIAPPAMFRSIEKFQPTLIIDEADAFFSENEDLRGIINSGHTRPTAYVIRTVGDDHEPKKFTTWAFKAIAGIGKRAATIEDRSIGVALKRKLPDEKVERLRYAKAELFETLAPSARDFVRPSYWRYVGIAFSGRCQSKCKGSLQKEYANRQNMLE